MKAKLSVTKFYFQCLSNLSSPFFPILNLQSKREPSPNVQKDPKAHNCTEWINLFPIHLDQYLPSCKNGKSSHSSCFVFHGSGEKPQVRKVGYSPEFLVSAFTCAHCLPVHLTFHSHFSKFQWFFFVYGWILIYLLMIAFQGFSESGTTSRSSPCLLLALPLSRLVNLSKFNLIVLSFPFTQKYWTKFCLMLSD